MYILYYTYCIIYYIKYILLYILHICIMTSDKVKYFVIIFTGGEAIAV